MVLEGLVGARRMLLRDERSNFDTLVESVYELVKEMLVTFDISFPAMAMQVSISVQMH
jgi:hypothetical protein